VDICTGSLLKAATEGNDNGIQAGHVQNELISAYGEPDLLKKERFDQMKIWNSGMA